MTNAELPFSFVHPADSAGSLSGAVQAMHAVSRLVAASGGEDGDQSALGGTLVAEARALLGASRAVLLAYADEGRRAIHVAGDPLENVTVADHPALHTLLAERRRSLVLEAPEAGELARQLLQGTAEDTASAMLVTVPTAGATHVLVLTHPDPEGFAAEAVAATEALAGAGVAALARRRAAEQVARRAAGHQALTRAAKTLNASLDLATVLRRIADEANRILDGDYTAVYRGTRDGAVIEAAAGMPPEMLGFSLAPDQGLSGKVLTSERSMLTNDYQALSALPSEPFFDDVHACLAVPMRWGGELRGVLTVGYKRPFEATVEHLGLLEAFAELAVVACTNASAHAGLVLAARTDGLTGCLNHAALHETLRQEIGRAERASDPALSLIMVDLDDFKAVNDMHGHLVGDEVLRRAGHALRQATRPYDIAARYGGDEFALLAVDADEEEAQEIARRATERIALAIGDLCEGGAGRATAGVAQWRVGISAVDLIADADRALLFGKHEDGRGGPVVLSTVPDWFRPGRFARRLERGSWATAPPAPRSTPAVASSWPEGPGPDEQRLRERARALARTTTLGAELTGLVDEPALMLETATRGITEALGAAASAVFRLGEDGVSARVASAGEDSRPDAATALVDRCVAEGRPLLAAGAAARARMAVPVRVDGDAWGSLTVLAAKAGGLTDDHLHLVSALAEHVGAAIGAGERHAAALAAAASRS